MLLFYLKLIFRRNSSRPQHPFIVLLSLCIGFIASILVITWMMDELSYDRYHEKADRTYRLTVRIDDDEMGFHWDFARSSFGWLMHMPDHIPGIEAMVRLGTWHEGIVKVDDQVWDENIYSADTTLTDVFTLPFIAGNPQTCLSQPRQVIISENRAKKFFGDKSPIDETIYLYGGRNPEPVPYLVTGVFKDFPANSHMDFHLLASFENPKDPARWAYYYLLLEENSKPERILESFNEFALNFTAEQYLSTLFPELQKITDIHLHSAKDRELKQNGSIKQVILVGGMGLLVLFITFFNFFNLRYVFLIKDIRALNILRLNGSKIQGIYTYLFTESFLFNLMAALISFYLAFLALPWFNQLLGKQPTAGTESLFMISLVSLSILIISLTLIGILPFLIFRFGHYLRTIGTQKVHSGPIHGIRISRPKVLKTIIGLQYVISFVLIIAIFTVNGQLKILLENRLGNEHNNIIALDNIPVQSINKFDAFRNLLLGSPLITDVTSSMEKPGQEIRDMANFETTGLSVDSANKLLYLCPVDDNFFRFYNIPIIAGYDFPRYSGNDSIAENFILNERAVKYLGWEPHEAIGKPIRLHHNHASGETGRIIGVVKDFQPSSMKQEIRPYVFLQKSFWLFSAQILYDTTRTSESISVIEEAWRSVYPGFPLMYEFVDDIYRDVYKSEYQLKHLSILLCILAILLSAIGLFGITAIVYASKTKEIGIRKVNGANTETIMGWLLKDISKSILWALVIAIPLAWYVAELWLNNYVYRFYQNTWMYLLASGILICSAFITVIWQSRNAARMNPVDALKYQ
jgi:putative ABC transport system permease protein